MFTRFPLLIFLFFFASSFIPAEEGLHLNITKLRSNKGHVLVCLFKDGSGYPDKPKMAFRINQLIINNKTASTSFFSLPEGRYAIAVLHDENDDGKMNTNWIGLPKEGYGFSNNVMGAFGPPELNKATIVHKAGATTLININIRY